MMGNSRPLGAYTKIKLISADPFARVSRLCDMGIHFHKLSYLDAVTITANIPANEYAWLSAYLKETGDSLVCVKDFGFNAFMKTVKKRILLVIGVFVLLCLTLMIPTRLLFIRVEGNQSVSTQRILEAAKACGTEFFALSKDVRTDALKNALMTQIREISWASIKVNGCSAVITVKEREQPDVSESQDEFGSIISTADGVITDIQVLKGTPKCSVGQAVVKGQLLVSGYTDCGILIKAEAARAEIKAETMRAVVTVSPAFYALRKGITEKNKRFSLLLGKMRIKLYNDGGIYDTTCVKMYEENYLTLPGGFPLPLALITETVCDTETEAFTAAQADDLLWQNDASDFYILNQLNAGSIMSVHRDSGIFGSVLRSENRYVCQEHIGKVSNEVNLNSYGTGH